jgi:hypothetical protein
MDRSDLKLEVKIMQKILRSNKVAQKVEPYDDNFHLFYLVSANYIIGLLLEHIRKIKKNKIVSSQYHKHYYLIN